MDEISNNPAGRLNDLISKMRKVRPERQVSNRNQNTTVAQAWSEILDIDPDDRSSLLNRLSRVVVLPLHVKKAVQAHEVLNQDIYLEWVKPVERAVSEMNLQAPWKNVTQHLNETQLRSLLFCDDQLSRICPDPIADPEELENLRKLIKEALDSLNNAVELPIYLQKFMYEKLYAIDAAIIDYQFLGSSPLQQVFESSVGAVTLNRDLYIKSKDDKEAKPFWDTMSRLATVVSLTSNGQRLLGKSTDGMKFLLDTFGS